MTSPGSNRENNLIELVQMHERSWGEEIYPDRPDLAEILNAQVVVFWQSDDPKEKRATITVHTDLADLERALSRMFLRLNATPIPRRIARVFDGGKRMIITGVQVEFQPAPEE